MKKQKPEKCKNQKMFFDWQTSRSWKWWLSAFPHHSRVCLPGKDSPGDSMGVMSWLILRLTAHEFLPTSWALANNWKYCVCSSSHTVVVKIQGHKQGKCWRKRNMYNQNIKILVIVLHLLLTNSVSDLKKHLYAWNLVCFGFSLSHINWSNNIYYICQQIFLW